jgi:RNA polymerase sigma-70 factor (ECF subfamily)
VKRDLANDRALFVALQRGEDTALDRLIARWRQPLFAFAWRYVHNQADAQDLVAETFVRLYQQRARLRDDTKLSAWLFTTLSNLCHNQHRWRRRHPTVSFDAPDTISGGMAEVAGDSPLPTNQLEHDEQIAQLMVAVNKLPHDLKVTLLLHYFERLSYKEIAEVVGCSERGVETRLYRARNRLKVDLGSFLEIAP